MRAALGILVAALAFTTLADAQSDLMARARAIHKQVPLIDGHNDYPWALRGLDPGRDFKAAEISKPVPALMTDIPRLRQGGVGGQFWSVYVPSDLGADRAVTMTCLGGRPSGLSSWLGGYFLRDCILTMA